MLPNNITSGTKIVCINDLNSTYLKLNHIYVFKDRSQFLGYIDLIESFGFSYPEEYFITLKEFRLMKLKEFL